MKTKRVLAVHDLCSFGRCSLTAAIPVISAMGMQVCPLPTAFFSNNLTYGEFTFHDFTDKMTGFMDRWEKLGFRYDAVYSGFLLVPHQDHHKISRLFADYILDIAPDSVQVKVTPMHGGQGYVCPIPLPAYQAAEKGFEKAFGKKPLAVRRGGSIPIISTFEQVLGIKTVLMGFGLESNAIHSPNENIPLDIFRKGIEAVVEFYLNYK